MNRVYKKKIYFFLKIYFVLMRNLITRLIHFNQLKPHSVIFGLDRGQAIDRYYIENFLDNNSKHIKGKVLEFGDDRYSLRFECKKPDIISIDKKSKNMISRTSNLIMQDITKKKLAPNKYNTVIATQVLQFIFEIENFKKNIHKTLKTNGYLILTCSGISPLSDYDIKKWGEFWRFTEISLKKIFKKHFKIIKFETHGNLYVAEKFLRGYAVEEISKKKLNFKDKSFPVVYTLLLRKK
jgi:hypothetical protein